MLRNQQKEEDFLAMLEQFLIDEGCSTIDDQDENWDTEDQFIEDLEQFLIAEVPMMKMTSSLMLPTWPRSLTLTVQMQKWLATWKLSTQRSELMSMSSPS